MKELKEMEQELYLKEQRVSYWEKFGFVPSFRELTNYVETGNGSVL